MKSTEYSSARAAIVYEHLEPVIKDLRLVDVADYIAFIRCELLGNLADIVQSATELHFLPDTLHFGHGGEYELDWNTAPKVVIDLEFRHMGVYVYFRLCLESEASTIDLLHITFEKSGQNPDENTRLLAKALETARVYPATHL